MFQLWDLRTTRPMHEFKGHTETVEACCFLPTKTGEGNLLATSSNDCSVRIWDQDSAGRVKDGIHLGDEPGIGQKGLNNDLSFDVHLSAQYAIRLLYAQAAPCSYLSNFLGLSYFSYFFQNTYFFVLFGTTHFQNATNCVLDHLSGMSNVACYI